VIQLLRDDIDMLERRLSSDGSIPERR